MLHQTFLFLEQLWQLFEVSQILEFLRYTSHVVYFYYGLSCSLLARKNKCSLSDLQKKKTRCLSDSLRAEPGCSKLTTSLVNVSIKLQTLISEIQQHFLLKKCEKFLHYKNFSHFFQQKQMSVYLVTKSYNNT